MPAAAQRSPGEPEAGDCVKGIPIEVDFGERAVAGARYLHVCQLAGDVWKVAAAHGGQRIYIEGADAVTELPKK